MAILELQFRKQSFLDFFKAQINSQRLPFPTLDVFVYPQLKGHLLERIECVGCSVDPSEGSGQVTVHAALVIHYNTSLATIRAAGSLNPPVTEQLAINLPVTLSIQFVTPPSGTPQPQLQWQVPFNILPPGLVPLTLPKSLGIQSGAVEADADVVAIRLGTGANDPVNAPIINRLGGDDWSQLVSGQLIADQLAANLSVSLAPALSDKVILDSGPSGAWVPFAPLSPWKTPFAMASAELVAVDQCILNIDISVNISLVAELTVSGIELTTTLTLNWDADSTLCDVVGTLLLTPIGGIAIHTIAENKASKEIFGTATDPAGFHKVGSTDSSITYQATTVIETPSPRFNFGHAEVTADGLLSSGQLRLQAGPRGLEGEASSPSSGLHIHCPSRGISVQFNPAEVYLRDIGMDGPPRLFSPGVLFDPPNAWVAAPAPTNDWLDLRLTFVDPPTGRLPVGTATSVYLSTDCGARWADLGVIPPDHAPPTEADMVRMISECMAISDRWDIFHLKWVVDPPALKFGVDPVRQWVVAIRELPPEVDIEFTAVARDGKHRPLGTISGRKNIAGEVITNAGETLQIRASHPVTGSQPTVFQRWISPFASIELKEPPALVAASGKLIAIREQSGHTQVLSVGSNGVVSKQAAVPKNRFDAPTNRLFESLNRVEKQKRQAWNTAARVGRNTVAITHGRTVLIGTMGPPVSL